ncbi:hypothetical protein WJX77_001276 [Trebouxia sp. C0004]
MVLADGSYVGCQLCLERTGKAAGGKKCTDEVSPAIQKKGPDSWQVNVQMFTPSAGTHHCVLKVKLDIFWRVHDPVKRHIQIRITQCSDLHVLQHWCRAAVVAAALAPAEAVDPPLTAATGWHYHSGSLECAGSAGSPACISDVGPGLNGNFASVNVPQHEDALEDLASMMYDIMPATASLSREGASITVQSAPPPSAPTTKRVRNDSSGPGSPSQPTVHYSTVSTEDITQRLQSLELNVSGVHLTLQAHDDKLDRLHGLMGEHTDDLIDMQVELATRQGLHNATRTAPGAADKLQSCSNNTHHPVGHSSFPSLHGQSASNQANASHAHVTLPQPRPHHGAPTHHTLCSASTVSCPPFDGSLTHAQLRPAILRALAIHKLKSRSALDLSRILWPGETAMRKAMNTMVKGVLYSDEMVSMVERNGTHWALKF